MTLLHVTSGYNDHKFYIDGRRCRRDRYDAVFRDSNRRGKISCSVTKRKNGAWYHYVQAD